MNYLLLLFSLFSHNSNYCSCIPLGPIDESQYNEYNLIVKGKVSKVVIQSFEKSIYLAVDVYYKGGDKQTTIKITTPSLEGMCGIVPKVGENWLIFAYADEKNYRTELCTRTKNMNPKAWNYNKDEIAKDIIFLETKIISNSH